MLVVGFLVAAVAVDVVVVILFVVVVVVIMLCALCPEEVEQKSNNKHKMPIMQGHSGSISRTPGP